LRLKEIYIQLVVFTANYNNGLSNFYRRVSCTSPPITLASHSASASLHLYCKRAAVDYATRLFACAWHLMLGAGGHQMT
jgi:hypothetical protein